MIFSPLPGIVNVDYRKTQGYGERPNVYKPWKGHLGVDLAGKKKGMKVPLYLPHEGWITVGWDEDGFGNYVRVVSDPFGPNKLRRVSYLGHMDTVSIKNGIFYSAREMIGIMGMTGWADGVHVHWEYFLTNEKGVVKDQKNGYNGRLNIAPYASAWHPSTVDSELIAAMATTPLLPLPEEDDAPACNHVSPLQTETSILLPF